MVHYYYGRLSAAAAASEQGLLQAERAHDTRQQGQHRLVRMHAAQGGFTSLDQVADLLEDDLAWARQTGSLGVEAKATLRLSAVRGALGDAAGRDELFARGWASCAELGLEIWAAGFVAMWIWELTDEPEIAEVRLRESYRVLAAAGKRRILSTVAAILAECLRRQGRHDEAEQMLDVAAEAGDDDDLMTQVRLCAGRALLLATRGNGGEAAALARKGVALAGETEYVYLRGDSLLALGEVLRIAGRRDEAADAFREAAVLWRAKRAVTSERAARAALTGLGEWIVAE
jgi:tetratricopeptide (TPR) repeat protein